jgi:hypothetical protein
LVESAAVSVIFFDVFVSQAAARKLSQANLTFYSRLMFRHFDEFFTTIQAFSLPVRSHVISDGGYIIPG